MKTPMIVSWLRRRVASATYVAANTYIQLRVLNLFTHISKVKQMFV